VELHLGNFVIGGSSDGVSIQVDLLHCTWTSCFLTSLAECIVSPFTGDNPATILPFSTPGDAVLSLGTSTTILLSIPPSERPPQRFTNSHLLAHPTTSNAYIAMLCFKNGALAREEVRDSYAGGSWTKFNELVNSSPPGNNGFVGLYFPLPEIIPSDLHGTFFFSTKDGLVQPLAIEEFPDALHPRAILESQFLSIRSRIKNFLPRNTSTLNRLIITGGSASNPVIQQLAADVFGVQVFVIDGHIQSAAAGGALLARYAWCRREKEVKTFEMMMANTRSFEKAIKLVAEPQGREVYEKLVEAYVTCEGYAARAHADGKLALVSPP
jgi:xylulokinase